MFSQFGVPGGHKSASKVHEKLTAQTRQTKQQLLIAAKNKLFAKLEMGADVTPAEISKIYSNDKVGVVSAEIFYECMTKYRFHHPDYLWEVLALTKERKAAILDYIQLKIRCHDDNAFPLLVAIFNDPTSAIASIMYHARGGLPCGVEAGALKKAQDMIKEYMFREKYEPAYQNSFRR